MKKKYILLVLSIILISLILILNYDNILKLRYNLAVKNKNCEKIYDLVDIEDGRYLTKEKYIDQCELKIDNYDNSDVKVVNHKIKNDIVNIYHNITIHIPSDSVFYLDDKLIYDDFTNDSNELYKIFTINKLYEGEYNIKFINQKDEENDKIVISQDNIVEKYEYKNAKQTVTVIGYTSCSYCKNLLSFLSTLDNNIFEVKYYDIYASGNKQETKRATNEFLQYFKTNVNYYPTVIIGDKYLLGYIDSMEKEYIDAIYYAYRNEIETVVK